MTGVEHSRADLHCHSTASAKARLGIQRALGLPECATPSAEVYELAKRRGMDFVTITDHDTVAGVLEIADRPDVFVSEELTAGFKGEPQAVHVLCLGITPADHEWLQAHADDVEECADFLHGNDITCALAHPFYAVAAPLTARHRRRLAELFPIWETRNGSRARELNMPPVIYVETHGGTGVGGSDDHAGVDVGRTFTRTPPASTPEEFLRHLRDGRAEPCGTQGSAAKWVHAAIALALRTVGPGAGKAPDPAAVLAMVERVVADGDVRGGTPTAGLGRDDARALLRAWLEAVELDAGGLIAHFQDDAFSHADLYRRARTAHERKLRRAVARATASGSDGDIGAAVAEVFEAAIPAIPYVPATAFLSREKAKLARREDESRRVAVVADGVGSVHGVTRTVGEIRERGVPGFEVEVVGTDVGVDRRLSTVAEVEIPFYAEMRIGVPSLTAIVETLAEGRYDLVHLCSPAPASAGAALVAQTMAIPTVGSYHTELATYAALRSGDARLEVGMRTALALLYGHCHAVLSPSASSDASLRALGVPAERIGRWERGVDAGRFDPARREEGLFPGELNVLYAGRQTAEKGADLLADAFLAACERDPRLHLVLAGGGPEEGALRERLGEHATFLGWLEGEELARAYASADVFLFASRTDTFGQVILEAHASGLPVVAVEEGGPAGLVDDGVTGLLRPPDAAALAEAVLELAASAPLRDRIARAARASVAHRTWDAALGQLAEGYCAALATGAAAGRRRVA